MERRASSPGMTGGTPVSPSFRMKSMCSHFNCQLHIARHLGCADAVESITRTALVNGPFGRPVHRIGSPEVNSGWMAVKES